MDVLMGLGYNESIVKGRKTVLLKGFVEEPKEVFMVNEELVRKVLGRVADSKGKFKDVALEMLSDKGYKGYTNKYVAPEKAPKKTVATYKAKIEELEARVKELEAELMANAIKNEDTGFNLAE